MRLAFLQKAEEAMAVIKAAEFAWPRMEAPGLDEMEERMSSFPVAVGRRTAGAFIGHASP